MTHIAAKSTGSNLAAPPSLLTIFPAARTRGPLDQKSENPRTYTSSPLGVGNLVLEKTVHRFGSSACGPRGFYQNRGYIALLCCCRRTADIRETTRQPTIRCSSLRIES